MSVLNDMETAVSLTADGMIECVVRSILERIDGISFGNEVTCHRCMLKRVYLIKVKLHSRDLSKDYQGMICMCGNKNNINWGSTQLYNKDSSHVIS